MIILNPFITKGYVSPDLFCNREKELKILTKNAKNGIYTTLISPRRMGKSGLIYRFFDYLEEKSEDYIAIYVDIFSSRSLDDFVKLFSEALFRFYPEKTSFGKRFMQLLKSLRPVISYDAITGAPQVQIIYQTPQEKEVTLRGLFDFLENQDKKVILAIDEFQQITEYPEKNMEALLRTYIQPLNNINFIFCGSKSALMLEIFSGVKRPFFSMTQFLNLGKIASEKYAVFITGLFERAGKKIDPEAVRFILEWTFSYTYYTQQICNEVFSISKKRIDIHTVKSACNNILQQSEPIFLQYRQLLTPAQWNFLIAVAKEEKVEQLTAQNFLSKYKIGTPANAKRISKALLEKDLLLAEATSNSIVYQVYDVFLLRWLQSRY